MTLMEENDNSSRNRRGENGCTPAVDTFPLPYCLVCPFTAARSAVASDGGLPPGQPWAVVVVLGLGVHWPGVVVVQGN